MLVPAPLLPPPPPFAPPPTDAEATRLLRAWRSRFDAIRVASPALHPGIAAHRAALEVS